MPIPSIPSRREILTHTGAIAATAVTAAGADGAGG